MNQLDRREELKPLADFIRNKRKERKLTRIAAAAQAPLAYMTWTRLENQQSRPDTLTLEKVARVLEVPLADLLQCLKQGDEGTFTSQIQTNHLEHIHTSQPRSDDFFHSNVVSAQTAAIRTSGRQKESIMSNPTNPQLTFWLELARKLNASDASTNDMIEIRHSLNKDRDALLSALNQCAKTKQDVQVALELAGELATFWEHLGDFTPERSCLAALLECEREPEWTRARARALNTAGILAGRQQDYEEEVSRFESAIAICEDLGEYKIRSLILNNLGMDELSRSEFDAARRHFQMCLDADREACDLRGEATSLNNLGIVASATGQFRAALTFHQTSRELYEEIGSDQVAYAICGQAEAYLGQAEVAKDKVNLKTSLERAEEHFNEGLRLFQRQDHKLAAAACLEKLAKIQVLRENSERAAFLLGAADNLREELKQPRSLDESEEYEFSRGRARRSLGPQRFHGLLAEGRRTTLEQAVEYAGVA